MNNKNTKISIAVLMLLSFSVSAEMKDTKTTLMMIMETRLVALLIVMVKLIVKMVLAKMLSALIVIMDIYVAPINAQ